MIKKFTTEFRGIRRIFSASGGTVAFLFCTKCKTSCPSCPLVVKSIIIHFRLAEIPYFLYRRQSGREEHWNCAHAS